MTIIVKNPLKIVATILVRNEEDIIGPMIEHHIRQGVRHFIVTNNNSTDQTRSLVERFPEVVEIIDEPGTNHHQSKWVSRMAQMACKLSPDWIVHLDADEFWMGLQQLRTRDGFAIGCTTMFLHPPTGGDLNSMRHYLDFESIPGYVGECKVAHRPDPNIVITHGNHGILGADLSYTQSIWRHHFPVRSCDQFIRKAVNGHRSLLERNAICDRWQKWHDLHEQGKLVETFRIICQTWHEMKTSISMESLCSLMEFWSTPDMISFLRRSGCLPTIREWSILK